MTMGEQWSYKPNDNYKSPRKLIHLSGNIVNALQFTFGFDIETEDTNVDGTADFRHAFANPGKYDFLRISAGMQDTL